MTESPYGKYVEGKDTVKCLEETPRLIEAAVRGWSSAEFERSYAPGKWSARQILAHLAQFEMVFATRLRFAADRERRYDETMRRVGVIAAISAHREDIVRVA